MENITLEFKGEIMAPVSVATKGNLFFIQLKLKGAKNMIVSSTCWAWEDIFTKLLGELQEGGIVRVVSIGGGSTSFEVNGNYIPLSCFELVIHVT